MARQVSPPQVSQSTQSSSTIAPSSKQMRELPPIELADDLVRDLLPHSPSTSQPATFDQLPEFEPHSLDKTVLYLAYGSNLAASTFLGSRGIRPLSSINVLVPSLKLTFDLPGLPYAEPCFANTKVRDPAHPIDDDPAWRHGVVGVAYEVTKSDFAHIINTEGGGSSYKDVKVLCYPLERGLKDIPSPPTSVPFTAHTLLAERLSWLADGDAEPSERYKGLLTTGAAENELPETYQAYLAQLPSYHITSFRQTAGKWIMLLTFGPFFGLLLALFKIYGNDKGKAPNWVASLADLLFKGLHNYYAYVVKPVCGDGEKTMHNTRTVKAWPTREKGAAKGISNQSNGEQMPLL